MTRFSRSSDRPMIGAQNILMGHIIEQPDLWRTFPFDAANRLFPYLRWCLILDENPCKLVESTADYVAREGTCGKNFFISCARDTFFFSACPFAGSVWKCAIHGNNKQSNKTWGSFTLDALPCSAMWRSAVPRDSASPPGLRAWEVETWYARIGSPSRVQYAVRVRY